MINTNCFSCTEIVGFGSGLVDFLAYVDDKFIFDLEIEKGGVTIVDIEVLNSIIKHLDDVPVIVPGGAACNTIVGVSQLGSSAKFVGKIGSDELGVFFEKYLIKNNVIPDLLYSEIPTGRVLSLITPDAQRTMLTYLGASSTISSKEIVDKYFKTNKFVYIEGHMLFNPDLVFSILNISKQINALIIFDLANFIMVEKNQDLLNELIFDYIDVLIGNEDEAKAYTNCSNEIDALRIMSKYVKIAAVKLGEKGSLIQYEGIIYKIPPMKIDNVIDTTGAGDLWASGLLFGLLKDLPLEKCGKIATVCSSEVCKVTGSSISTNKWNKIKNIVHNI